MDFGPGARPAEVEVALQQVRRRPVAPAVVVDAGDGHEDRPSAGRGAHLGLGLPLTVRTSGKHDLAAGIGEAGLQSHRQRSTQGVQAEYRVGALERDRRDRLIGDQVPVDRVAEWLVEPRPIQIDRQALGVAGQRRGLETPIVQIGLERIVLRVAEGNACQLGVQGP